MSVAIIKASDAAAWAGKSLVDSPITESGDLIILNNSIGSTVNISGISDEQSKGDTRRVVNRGANDVVFTAEDTTALAKDRFVNALTLSANQSLFMLYNGTRWELYSEA